MDSSSELTCPENLPLGSAVEVWLIEEYKCFVAEVVRSKWSPKPLARLVENGVTVYLVEMDTAIARWRVAAAATGGELCFDPYRSQKDETPPIKSKPVSCIHCHEVNEYADANRLDGSFICYGCKPHSWRYDKCGS